MIVTIILLLVSLLFVSAIVVFPHKACEQVVQQIQQVPKIYKVSAQDFVKMGKNASVEGAAVAVDFFAIHRVMPSLNAIAIGRKARDIGFAAIVLYWDPSLADTSFAGIVAIFDWDIFECPIPIFFAQNVESSRSEVKLNVVDNPEYDFITGGVYITFVSVLITGLFLVLLVDTVLHTKAHVVKNLKSKFNRIFSIFALNLIGSILGILSVLFIQFPQIRIANYQVISSIVLAYDSMNDMKMTLFLSALHRVFLEIEKFDSNMQTKFPKFFRGILIISALLGSLIWAISIILIYVGILNRGSIISVVVIVIGLFSKILISLFYLLSFKYLKSSSENKNSKLKTDHLPTRFIMLSINSILQIIAEVLFFFSSTKNHFWVFGVYSLFFGAVAGLLLNRGLKASDESFFSYVKSTMHSFLSSTKGTELNRALLDNNKELEMK